MKKRVVLWTLLLSILGGVLPCTAQQIMYANLKELREEQGDTVTTLQVERRSKNQIYLMGGADYRITAPENSGMSRYLRKRCYAVRVDTALYVNCRKMRYKRYRFGQWYAPAMWVGGKIYFSAQPVGQAATSTLMPADAASWEARSATPLPLRDLCTTACTTSSTPRRAVPNLSARRRCCNCCPPFPNCEPASRAKQASRPK